MSKASLSMFLYWAPGDWWKEYIIRDQIISCFQSTYYIWQSGVLHGSFSFLKISELVQKLELTRACIPKFSSIILLFIIEKSRSILIYVDPRSLSLISGTVVERVLDTKCNSPECLLHRLLPITDSLFSMGFVLIKDPSQTRHHAISMVKICKLLLGKPPISRVHAVNIHAISLECDIRFYNPQLRNTRCY